MATAGYKAAYEGADTNVSFQSEATWDQNPDGSAGTFTTVRLTNWSDGYQRDETRPAEIRRDGVVPEAITTRIAVTPSMTCPFVPATLSPLIAAGINGEFSLGTVTNDIIFNSFTLLRQMAANEMRVFTGCTPNGFSVSISQGQTGQITFPFLGSQLALGTTPTDTVTAPDTETVFSPITGVSNLQWNGADIGTSVMSLDLTVTKEGAEATYGLGSAAAGGMSRGAISVSASIVAYLNDPTLFNAMVAETKGALTFSLRSGTAGYDFLLPVTKIGSIDDPLNGAGPIQATIPLTASPDASGVAIQIDEVS